MPSRGSRNRSNFDTDLTEDFKDAVGKINEPTIVNPRAYDFDPVDVSTYVAFLDMKGE